MATSNNIKVKFTADTGGIKTGAKEAKEAIKEFDSSASSLLDNFANMFGVSISSVTSGLKTLEGGLLTAQKGMTATATGSTLLSKALNVLKLALVSTGIGAIVVALGSLIAYFTSSQRGADKLARGLAPLKQVLATLKDFAVALGEKIVAVFENPVESVKSFASAIKDNITNRFTALIESFSSLGTVIEGVFTLDWDKIKQGAADYADSSVQFITGMTKEQRAAIIDDVGGAWDEVKKRSQEAYDLEVRKQALIEREREEKVALYNLEAESAALRQKAEDKQLYTAQERLEYSKAAESAVNELITRRKNIEQERLAILELENSLSESMNADLDAEADIKIAIAQLDKSRADKLKEIRNNQKGIADEVQKEAEELAKVVALQQAKDQMQLIPDSSSFENAQNIFSENQTIPFTPTLPDDAFEKLKSDYDNGMKPFLEDMTIDLEGFAEDGIIGFADAFGEALGNMMTGENGLKGFISSVVEMIAGMVSSIGQMLIKAGVGMIAMKNMMKNPYLAIAAGAAMVAIASMLSTAVSNTLDSSGSSSSISSSVLQSGSSTTIPSTVSTSASESVTINVTGTLKGSGSELVAVINSENNRRSLTT